MSRRFTALLLAMLAALPACGGSQGRGPTAIAATRTEASDRLGNATRIVQHLATEWDGALPRSVAGAARCVAIVPGLVHAGLLIGIRGGQGVMTCRDGTSWSRPDFFRLSGASAGLSAGVQSVDLVMLVMTNAGEAALLEGNMEIGAGTSVVAGPVGRTAMAATEIALRASIVYYSRAEGLFVGLDLSGTRMERDEASSRAFYGDARDFGALLRGAPPLPAAAATFRAEVERVFSD